MRSISNEKNLRDKKILLRLDLNVPLNKGNIIDTTRIDKILPTLKFLNKQKAKVIILSHVGRPKGRILKEAKYIFYDSQFIKRLDENHQLIGFENGVYDLDMKKFIVLFFLVNFS